MIISLIACGDRDINYNGPGKKTPAPGNTPVGGRTPTPVPTATAAPGKSAYLDSQTAVGSNYFVGESDNYQLETDFEH